MTNSQDNQKTSEEPGPKINIDQKVGRVERGGKVIGVLNVIKKYFTLSLAEARELRDLELLINKVKKFWIKDVLEKSVPGDDPISLDKETRPNAVEHGHTAIAGMHEEADSAVVPPEQTISDVFDEFDQSMLILGAPGSGKTITLLELTRELIPRAEKEDATQPVPVVFKLSTRCGITSCARCSASRASSPAASFASLTMPTG